MRLFTPKDVQDRIKIKDDVCVSFIDGYTLASVFQPIKHKFSLVNYGFEALVRVYKNGKAINPLTFFSKYKSEIEITNVGILCYSMHVRNAMRVVLPHEKLFINAHPKMFSCIANDSDSIAATLKRMELCGFYRQQLVIEITEFKEGGIELFKKGVKEFNSLGVNIAIDDYGALESNRSRVEIIRPNIVKVDRSLISNFLRNPKDNSLEQTLTSFKNEKLMVVVEGIENIDEFNAIKHLSFDYVQGYFFGKPQGLYK